MKLSRPKSKRCNELKAFVRSTSEDLAQDDLAVVVLEVCTRKMPVGTPKRFVEEEIKWQINQSGNHR